MELKKGNDFVLKISQLRTDTEKLVSILKNPVDVYDARKNLNKHLNESDEERKEYTRQVDAFKKDIMARYKYALEPAEKLKKEFDKEIDKMTKEKMRQIEQLPGYDEFIKYHEFDKKWLNKTVTLNHVKSAISNTLESDPVTTRTITLKGAESKIDAVIKKTKKDKVEVL